ncbi:hypothetical protein GAYE_SCF34G4961 [Galdieria yellowstonensis]|uniref:Uncharacterized protein n=1 Tax=Galdieria yellowstonensis TaxID=3028027 RepID=A0AAV9IHW2_9RHOD|nr:hypothetical protein GAYE_SCF34G4961 [Galdieria yellowstonensis]
MSDPSQRYFSHPSASGWMPPGSFPTPQNNNLPMVPQPPYQAGYPMQPPMWPPGMAPAYGMQQTPSAYTSVQPGMYPGTYYMPPTHYMSNQPSMRPSYSSSKSLVPANAQQGPSQAGTGQLVPFQDKDFAVHKAKEDMKSLEGEIARYKSENSSLKMKLSRTEENLKKLNEEIESLKNQFNAAHYRGPKDGASKMTREEKERVQTDLKSAEERNERLRREVVHLRVKINKMKNLVPLDVSETQKALESLEQKFDVLERRLLKSSQGGNRGARKFAVEQIINMNQLGEISGALRGLRMIAESSLTATKERDGSVFGQRENLQEILSHLSSLDVRVAELVSYISNQLKVTLESLGLQSNNLPSLSNIQNISTEFVGNKSVEASPNLQRRTRSLSDGRSYSDDYGLVKGEDEVPTSPSHSYRGNVSNANTTVEHSGSSLSSLSNLAKQAGYSQTTSEGSWNQLNTAVASQSRPATAVSPTLKKTSSNSVETKQTNTVVEDVTSDLVDLSDLDISEQKKK